MSIECQIEFVSLCLSGLKIVCSIPVSFKSSIPLVVSCSNRVPVECRLSVKLSSCRVGIRRIEIVCSEAEMVHIFWLVAVSLADCPIFYPFRSFRIYFVGGII